MLNLYTCHSGFHSLISQMVSVRVFVYVRMRITNSIRFRRFSCCRLLFKCLYVVFFGNDLACCWASIVITIQAFVISLKKTNNSKFFLLQHFSQIKHFNSNFNFSLKFSPSLNSNETRRKIETVPFLTKANSKVATIVIANGLRCYSRGFMSSVAFAGKRPHTPTATFELWLFVCWQSVRWRFKYKSLS